MNTEEVADRRIDLLAIIRKALDGCDAGMLVERALSREPIRESAVWLIAAGKAAWPMADGASGLLGSQIRGGLIVGLDGPHGETAAPELTFVRGGHPVPTAGSEEGGRRALAVAKETAAADLLLVLLSGGASALMAVPADGVSLEDKQHTTEQLLRHGAEIHTLNAVRKHLSAIKGGQLAAAAQAMCRTLAISDVVGDDLSVIASGPTVGDASTFEDARAALRSLGGLDQYPPSVIARIDRGCRGEIPETPKPGDRRLARSVATVIGGRNNAMQGAAAEAEQRGYHVVVVDRPMVGEAREAAERHAQFVRSRAAGTNERLCIVSSGETTVHVTGKGTGGRNQEFSLAFALSAAAQPLKHGWVAASVGTDGTDGPTDAAGATADSTTLERARQHHLLPRDFLARNDTYPFFAALGDLIQTGPTGTNVGDLQIVLLG